MDLTETISIEGQAGQWLWILGYLARTMDEGITTNENLNRLADEIIEKICIPGGMVK